MADPQVIEDLAWAAYRLGKIDEARQAMGQVLTLSPGSSQAEQAKSFLAMTALDWNANNLDAAEPDIQKVLAADPGNVPALMAQAAVQVHRGDSKAAVGIYNQVLQEYPDFAPAQKLLAELYAADPANASKAYALAMNARKGLPDDPALARFLARLCYERKEYARAIQILQESARIGPLDAESFYYLGMSYSQANQRPQAQEALRKALAAGLHEPLAADAKRVVAESQKIR